MTSTILAGEKVTIHHDGKTELVRINKATITKDECFTTIAHVGSKEKLVYAYLPKYNTLAHGRLPAFHTHDCEAMVEYTGFVFSANLMVDIYCKDQQKDLLQQQLVLCAHCLEMETEALRASGISSWSEYLFHVAKEGRPIRKDGYIDIWKQVSLAVKELAAWHCAECKVDLGRNRTFLEVHHKDGKKENNARENLIPLCVACHSNVDDMHRRNYKLGGFAQNLKDYRAWLRETHSP